MIIDVFLISGGIYIGYLLLLSIGIGDARRFLYEPKHKKKKFFF